MKGVCFFARTFMPPVSSCGESRVGYTGARESDCTTRSYDAFGIFGTIFRELE
jgi:hypothetical protein